MKRSTMILFFGSILSVLPAVAHDFWLIPDFSARPGQAVKIVAHTGDKFPTGDSAVALDRIARFDAHSIRGKVAVAGVRVTEKATEAQATFKEPGTYVLAVQIKPRLIQLDASQFNEYLTHEGLNQILEMRAKEKKENTPGRELYAKFAKGLLQLGGKIDDIAMKPVGLKLEIVPEKDPTSVLPGEKLPVRVLFDGKPLANSQVSCVSDSHAGEHDYAFTARTNLQGIAMIPIQNPGTWLVRLVHMIPAGQGKDHEWVSFFSTLTFRIPPR